ncbi:trehalose-phosphatase [Sphingobium phenoxybenzoativorans]|uniref:Trehalose 6-phosphate phosphatase n=1 Tax=Sphingobium phenoxybenzoativorans TaxID=1592790 RepID=A0A975K517_9SPHN|nr:trehalose-phosphatase [Sphingobium phenoxybenzoativorans]QUT04965.1 trehalose-phosphatase [Sphingobium phenoxybenzoativorans]
MTLSDSPDLAGLPSPPPSLLHGAALFLDFDGTLVPLTDAPESVEVDAALIGLLARARDALGGRLAIVSGRSVATLRGLFGLDDFLLAGTHGLEFAEPGKPAHGPERLKAVDEAEAIFTNFIADKPGLLVERKTLSVGLHFRRAPEWMETCRALAEEVALATGLMIQPGKMLYELRPGGADKGTAVAELMKSAPMAGGMPIFVGDDLTDEEGMLAAKALGGCGILVGPLRVTAAQWHLEQVGAVRHYLSIMP